MTDSWDLLEDADPDTPPPAVEDQTAAQRAMRHIAALDAQLAEAERTAKAEVDTVTAWLHRRSDIILRKRKWWTDAIESYLRARHRTDGTKTLDLPHGVARLRSGRTRVEPVTAPGEDVPETWVRHEVKWDRSALGRKAVAGSEAPESDLDPVDGYTAHYAHDPATGAQIPGVVLLVPVEDSFSVTARTEGDDQ